MRTRPQFFPTQTQLSAMHSQLPGANSATIVEVSAVVTALAFALSPHAIEWWWFHGRKGDRSAQVDLPDCHKYSLHLDATTQLYIQLIVSKCMCERLKYGNPSPLPPGG